MNPLREFVSNFRRYELFQILEDQEIFEDKGFIGECLLREKANEYINIISNGDPKSFQDGVVTWMNLLVREVYRRLAYEWVTINSRIQHEST